jgi:chromosomal replication initiator protein
MEGGKIAMGAEMKMVLVHEDEIGLAQMWERVSMRLKQEYGRATYTSWIKHLTLNELKGTEVILSVPTRFIREWIVSHYVDTIERFWQEETPKILSINVVVRSRNGDDKFGPSNMNGIESTADELLAKLDVPQFQVEPVAPTIASGVDVTGQNIDVLNIPEDVGYFGSPLDRRFTFERFVVGKSNQLPFAAAKSIAKAKDIIQGNNPFYLYGKVGLGKTHLMHAIALHMRDYQPGRKVVYLSAERFMYQFVSALKNKDIMAFKDRFRGIDVLLIDDIQFICGKESTQEEFFHTLNALLDQNKQLIIASDRSPSELEGMQERIRSRLGWGLVVDINSADFELRLGILRSKVAQMVDVEIPVQVLEFLAGRIVSSIRELEGALNKVVAHATLMDKTITLETTQEILVDLLRANEKALTIADIQKRVTMHYNIKMTDMASSNRSRNVARPRQIAMYLAKRLTTRSLSEIGRKFGGKDHTTVMHAIKRVETLLTTDEELKAEIGQLEQMCCQ